MPSICPDALRALALVTLLVPLGGAAAPIPQPLRVCADPNNLPFSNRRLEGFENRLAELVARDLHTEIEYTWWAERRGFLRNTLKAGVCDVVLGLPTGIEMASTTRPYYRSSYVFVSRAARHLDIRSFDDPRLQQLRIGVQLTGDDYANTPPAHALARRGLVANVVGYTVYGDYAEDSPPARIIDAVASGVIDIAVVWGPLAGFHALRQRERLAVDPVTPTVDPPFPMTFAIAVGVRHGDDGRRAAIDAILARRRGEIARLLASYGVPLLPVEDTSNGSTR